MTKKGITNSLSYFFMVFAIITSACLLMREKMFNSNELLNTIITVIISFALSILLFFPIYRLNKYNNCNLIDVITSKTPIFAIAIIGIYMVYFTYASTYFIVQYLNFFVKSMGEPHNTLVILVIMLFVSGYGALKGFTILSRCGLIVAFITVVINVIVLLSSTPEINLSNLLAIDTINIKNILSDTDYLSSVLFILPICTILLYKLKGNIFKSYVGWAVGGALFTILTIIMVANVVGDYGKTQYYPAYTLSKSSKISILRGVDGLVFALFSCGAIILLSVFIICLNSIIAKEKSKTSTVLFCLVILIFSCILYYQKQFQAYIFNKYVILAANILTGTMLPLMFSFVKLKKGGLTGETSNA